MQLSGDSDIFHRNTIRQHRIEIQEGLRQTRQGSPEYGAKISKYYSGLDGGDCTKIWYNAEAARVSRDRLRFMRRRMENDTRLLQNFSHSYMYAAFGEFRKQCQQHPNDKMSATN